MQYDIWAINPAPDDDILRTNASIAAAGALTLLTTSVSPYGTGYKIGITSAGNDAGITFTIVGIKVGDLTGANTTEVVTGANVGVATSANFYTVVSRITASGASAGNVKIGSVGSLAFPRTRIKSFYFVGTANAGSVSFNLNSPTGTTLLKIDTPAGAGAFSDSVTIPGEGVLTTRSNRTDFAVMTLTEITHVTVFCG
jgi:hypothetical protein